MVRLLHLEPWHWISSPLWNRPMMGLPWLVGPYCKSAFHQPSHFVHVTLYYCHHFSWFAYIIGRHPFGCLESPMCRGRDPAGCHHVNYFSPCEFRVRFFWTILDFWIAKSYLRIQGEAGELPASNRGSVGGWQDLSQGPQKRCLKMLLLALPISETRQITGLFSGGEWSRLLRLAHTRGVQGLAKLRVFCDSNWFRVVSAPLIWWRQWIALHGRTTHMIS